MARDGWAVGILDIDGAAALRVAEQIAQTHGVPTLGVRADISDETSVDSAVVAVESSQWNRRCRRPVTGLVNVAGVSSPVPFLEVISAEWDRVFDVNCEAPSWSPDGSFPR